MEEKQLVLVKDLGMMYPTKTSKQKARYGIYRCHCGNEFKTQTSNIKSGHTTSCGCLQGSKTHGLKSHRLYNTWLGMVHRCNNPKCKYYKDYGGRGITVCDRWLSIENFIEDMYPTFIEGLTLDRKDNNLGYHKDNCRWVTKNIQARNTRTLRISNTSDYRGVTLDKSSGKYKSSIKVNSKSINIGYYGTALDAAKAYDKYVSDNKLEHTINGVL